MIYYEVNEKGRAISLRNVEGCLWLDVVEDKLKEGDLTRIVNTYLEINHKFPSDIFICAHYYYVDLEEEDIIVLVSELAQLRRTYPSDQKIFIFVEDKFMLNNLRDRELCVKIKPPTIRMFTLPTIGLIAEEKSDSKVLENSTSFAQQPKNTVQHTVNISHVLWARDSNPVLVKHKGNQLISSSSDLFDITKKVKTLDHMYDNYYLTTYENGNEVFLDMLDLSGKSGDKSLLLLNWLYSHVKQN